MIEKIFKIGKCNEKGEIAVSVFDGSNPDKVNKYSCNTCNSSDSILSRKQTYEEFTK